MPLRSQRTNGVFALSATSGRPARRASVYRASTTASGSYLCAASVRPSANRCP
jgi:hypothetical protein